MKYSYVMWIPTTEEGYPQILEKELPKETLRDDKQYEGVVIKGKIEKNYDIKIEYQITSDQIPHEVNFINVHKEKSGFLVYTLTLQETPVNEDFFVSILRKEMPTALYHYVKSFFHRHEYHEDEVDSKLMVYCTRQANFSFEKCRFDVLREICESYKEMFQGQLYFVQKELNDALYALAKDKRKFRNLKILDELAVSTNNILSEVAYCEFLLRQYCVDIPEDDCREIRCKVSVLQNYQRQIIFWNNHFHTKFSYSDGISGVRWGVAGFIVGCISLILSIILSLSNQSENKMREAIETNTKIINELEKDVKLLMSNTEERQNSGSSDSQGKNTGR